MALVILSTYGGLDAIAFQGVPGLGLVVGAGVFSRGRRAGWGVVAGIIGVAWSILLLWLRHPNRIDLAEFAAGVPFTIAGAINLGVVLLAGVSIGSGWTKAPRPELGEGEDRDLWD